MYKKLIAIVPAAGIGARALSADPALTRHASAGHEGGRAMGLNAAALPKQYRLLNGEPMLRWAVRALLADARIAQVRVAVAAHDIWVEQALAGLERTIWRPCGGPTRAQTVAAALLDADLAAEDWVLVHDAARPGLPADALARLIDSCLQLNTGGLLALPIADTVKQAYPLTDGPDALASATGDTLATIDKTLKRDCLWLAQTPQMFPALQLLNALQRDDIARGEVTDEASAMEMAGHAPCLISGSPRNFKVTWPQDFDLMEKWL